MENQILWEINHPLNRKLLYLTYCIAGFILFCPFFPIFFLVIVYFPRSLFILLILNAILVYIAYSRFFDIKILQEHLYIKKRFFKKVYLFSDINKIDISFRRYETQTVIGGGLSGVRTIKRIFELRFSFKIHFKLKKPKTCFFHAKFISYFGASKIWDIVELEKKLRNLSRLLPVLINIIENPKIKKEKRNRKQNPDKRVKIT
ncbi:MAG: hypothetical protein ACFFAH_12710 [Promethearchaeota archaeon]